jgi:nicotinate-nucleotide pyrophosphorylase (carboxylating)
MKQQPNALKGILEDLEDFVSRVLEEDVGTGDVTSNTVVPEDVIFHAAIAAREPLIVAGLPVAIGFIQRLAPDAKIEYCVEDGDFADTGTVLCRIEAPARALLTAERPTLNILQHMSGIATLTREYVDAIEGTGATLLDTRKTTPGLRMMEKYAVTMGGAKNHRIGLFDAVLIKDNHVALAGGITPTIARARAGTDLLIEVECDTLEQAKEAVEGGADMLLLDNMGPDRLREAVTMIDGRIPLEASGGINLQTIRPIAETGVDYISVGRITQSAPAMDIGMDFEAAG